MPPYWGTTTMSPTFVPGGGIVGGQRRRRRRIFDTDEESATLLAARLPLRSDARSSDQGLVGLGSEVGEVRSFHSYS